MSSLEARNGLQLLRGDQARRWLAWLSLIAFLLSWGALEWRVERARLAAEPILFSSLRLSHSVVPGEELSRDSFEIQELPIACAQDTEIKPEDLEEFLGSRAKLSLAQGRAIFPSDWSREGQAPSLAELVPRGRRAYILKAPANPFQELVKAGDWVDILQKDSRQSSLLLQRVRVLAVGGATRQADPSWSTTRGRRGRQDVALDVDLEQSQALLAAEGRGMMRIVLRNQEDQALAEQKNEKPRPRRAKPLRREIEHVR
ncbi:MAG: Flp pilus assembly protein CpaB [Polyangiaceae bacterium]|nr:Flp pilus assembly protein CpaB [Polyangiaceae bacterium]